jgi:hypothetical protein
MGRKIIRKKVKRGLAISEIILLITSIIAFSYVLGNSFSVVSAYDAPAESPTEETPEAEEPAVIGPSIIGGLVARMPPIAKLPLPQPSPGFVPPTMVGKTPTFLQKYLGSKGNLGHTLVTAGVVVVAIAFITYLSILHKTGDSGRALEAALRVGIGAGVGLGVYSGLVALGLGPAGWLATGFVILGAFFSKLLKREQDRDITFMCKPWQAQTGGAKCESCNNQDFPCTEYQCRSLGTGCEIINKDTDEPRCIWKDDKDVTPPNITAWVNALTEGYEYVPLIGQYGVEVKYMDSDDGCSPAFQPFTIGVALDKEGYCRIALNRTEEFSEMESDFGGKNLYMKNHTQLMTFPGVPHLEEEGIYLTNDGELDFYVRCEAATNGKANRDEFIFKLCIDKGPDTTSPEIRSFNWIDGAPIAYFEEDELREIDIEAYVNEPAQCKWSHEDKSYENMENNLTCPNSLSNFNAQLSYTCSGKLTGLENNRENKFFFRCNDSFGNVNIQSRTLTLIGTRLLFISSVEPNATTIKSSSDSIKVTLEAETSAGYKQGEATCYYSDTGTAGSYIIFSDTDSHTHSKNIWLGPGEHNYFIRCIDLAGNSDSREISFIVETDTVAPIVVRVFRDGSNLKIITNEEASCVYDNEDCLYDFDDGIGMTTSDDEVHSTGWDSKKNFYIKCQDEFGNEPPEPQSCSIIAKPFEI